MPKETKKPARATVSHSLDVTKQFVSKDRDKPDCYNALNLLTGSILKDMLRARGIGIPKTKHDMARLLHQAFIAGDIGFVIRIDVEIVKNETSPSVDATEKAK